MRRLTLTTALVLLLLVTSTVFSDVTRGARQCPTVKISCMDSAGCAEFVDFTAETTGAAGAKLSYNWTVSAGTIKSGQGTSSITVDVTGLAGTSVEATVQVIGLPEACAGNATCATALICDPGPKKFGEYENIRLSDERAKLSSFAATLQSDPHAQGYLLCYGGKSGRVGEAQARCNRAKNYLVTQHGFDARQIITVDGGYKEEPLVELWVLPSGVTPPTPSPTVDPKEVRIIKGGAKSRRRH